MESRRSRSRTLLRLSRHDEDAENREGARFFGPLVIMRILGVFAVPIFIVALFAWAPWATVSPGSVAASPLAELIRPLVEPPATDTLKVTRVIGGQDTFGRIQDVYVSDTLIVVLDSYADERVIVLDRMTGAVRETMGRAGRGPGELLTPRSLDADVGSGQRVWIYDNDNARISLHDIASWKAGPIRNVQCPAGLFQPVWVGDTLLSNGLFAAEMLRYYSADDDVARVVRAAGHSPFQSVTPDIALHLNRSALATDPSRERIVLAFLYVSRLQLYDRSGRLLKSVAGPEEVTPQYRVVADPRERMNRFLRNDETRFAYIDVEATADRIFALFSGRSRGEFEDEAYAGITIHVFNWDGGQVRQLILGETVYGIALDQQSQRMFGFRSHPFPAVVEFSSIPR